MTKFESNIKTIDVPKESVYGFLSDIKNLESLVPEGLVRNFESANGVIRLNIDGLGQIGVRMVDIQSHDSILFESEGSHPFRFNLGIDLQDKENHQTSLQLKFNAELNMMMKMVAQKPIEEGIERMAAELADNLNNRQWS
jgi:carbon monoxide dehydrogenase subunit G